MREFYAFVNIVKQPLVLSLLHNYTNYAEKNKSPTENMQDMCSIWASTWTRKVVLYMGINLNMQGRCFVWAPSKTCCGMCESWRVCESAA